MSKEAKTVLKLHLCNHLIDNLSEEKLITIGDSLLQKRYTTESLPFQRRYNHGDARAVLYCRLSPADNLPRAVLSRTEAELGEEREIIPQMNW